jgi:hypothetical protein
MRPALTFVALMGATQLLGVASVNADGPVAPSRWRYLLRAEEVPRPPWRPRRHPIPDRPWQGFARPEAWPPEPVSPRKVEPGRLAAALAQLCRRLPEDRARRYAAWMIEHARRFEVDPFLVAAVIYRRGRCRPGTGKDGVGLARIRVETHAPMIEEGRYRYWTLEQGAWRQHELDVSRFPFERTSLLRPEANIYFTAALLSVYSRQCRDLDAVIRSVRHRHPVSHLYWGDRVLGALFEDWVLQARRRLLRLYHDRMPPSLASFRGIPLYSPLDGAPRVVSSPFNVRRDHGRRHRGIDFFSTYGEPVRAVADGVVVFAGLDHPRTGPRELGPAASRRAPRRAMGRGGLFVIIDHGKQVRSGYFHLAHYTVGRGAKITAGQVIGYVGRTGIKETRSHLHFELRLRRRTINPTPHFLPYLLRKGKPDRRRRISQRPGGGHLGS